MRGKEGWSNNLEQGQTGEAILVNTAINFRHV